MEVLRIIAAGSLVFTVTGITDPGKIEPLEGDYNILIINRSRDADVVMYDVKLDSTGKLDQSIPVKVYWEKRSEDRRLEPITAIQKKFGYGILFRNITPDRVDFELVSYKHQSFQVRKSSNGIYRVFTRAGEKDIEVNSLYINFEDDSFWFPSISRIDIIGTDTEQGHRVLESIDPGQLKVKNKTARSYLK